jgi:hypothetical protein
MDISFDVSWKLFVIVSICSNEFIDRAECKICPSGQVTKDNNEECQKCGEDEFYIDDVCRKLGGKFVHKCLFRKKIIKSIKNLR